MKKASVRDLHLRTRAILAEVAGGRTIVIERRGVPVAELRPLQGLPTTRRMPNREALLAKFPPVKKDSGRLLEQDRS
jgi:antitoxin (DNA-binding transcriptional repressor) of toxin-antitoxin stability system